MSNIGIQKVTEFVFEIQNKPGYCMVRLFGFVDAATVQQIRPALQQSVPANCAHLIIDLKKVDFLDSHGIGMFVSLLKKVHVNQGKLIFAGADGQPASVLKMVGFSGPFVAWCDTAEQAAQLRAAK